MDELKVKKPSQTVAYDNRTNTYIIYYHDRVVMTSELALEHRLHLNNG